MLAAAEEAVGTAAAAAAAPDEEDVDADVAWCAIFFAALVMYLMSSEISVSESMYTMFGITQRADFCFG